ncbi:MAG TPA: hypothetical protein VK771_06685, partial [Acidimicrobiia bacterium]|nr:hypothetical protein [Acidimicrobiia bacterium]
TTSPEISAPTVAAQTPDQHDPPPAAIDVESVIDGEPEHAPLAPVTDLGNEPATQFPSEAETRSIGVAIEPTAQTPPQHTRGRWRRFVEEAASSAATSAPPQLSDIDSSAGPTVTSEPPTVLLAGTPPAPRAPDAQPELPVVALADTPSAPRAPEAQPELAAVARADPPSAPVAPDTGWYRLIAEATGRTVEVAPPPAPVDAAPAAAVPATTRVETKGSHRRKRRSRGPESAASTASVETEIETPSELEAPPTDEDLQTVIEVTAEIEHEVRPRPIRLPREAVSLAPIAAEELTESVAEPAPTNLQGRSGAERIGPIETTVTERVATDEVDVASATDTEAESVSEAAAQNESRWHQLLAEATATVDGPSERAVRDDVIAEPAPAPTAEPPKRRIRRRTKSTPPIDTATTSNIVDADPESASVTVQAAADQVDVATVPETPPPSEHVTPQTSPPPSRWQTFVSSAPTLIDDVASTPSPVEAFPEPAAADATPTRTTGSGSEAEHRVDTSLEIGALESGTIESINEVEVPVAFEAPVPISDVVVETDATVTDIEPPSDRVAPTGPERGSRYEKLLAAAPSQIDPAALAPDNGGAFVEPVATPKRIKGRRRRASVEPDPGTARAATVVDSPGEQTTERAAQPVDAAAVLISEAAELDTATTTASESAAERVAPPAPERGSRWDTLVASTPNQTETDAVDDDAFAPPDETEPIGEPTLATDVATVTETQPAPELESPPTELGSRWDKLVASSASQIDPITADIAASPEPE